MRKFSKQKVFSYLVEMLLGCCLHSYKWFFTLCSLCSVGKLIYCYNCFIAVIVDTGNDLSPVSLLLSTQHCPIVSPHNLSPRKLEVQIPGPVLFSDPLCVEHLMVYQGALLTVKADRGPCSNTFCFKSLAQKGGRRGKGGREAVL